MQYLKTNTPFMTNQIPKMRHNNSCTSSILHTTETPKSFKLQFTSDHNTFLFSLKQLPRYDTYHNNVTKHYNQIIRHKQGIGLTKPLFGVKAWL